MSLKVTSKLNIPGKATTWNASTWSSRWVNWYEQHFWTNANWPGRASGPLQKDHYGQMEVLQISKLWPRFKISSSLLICPIYYVLTLKKKLSIRGTKNLLTDADSSTVNKKILLAGKNLPKNFFCARQFYTLYEQML